MSQDVEFDLPFPPQINPDAEAAENRHARWARRFALVQHEPAIIRHRSWRPAEAAARWWPTATAADLDLAADISGWFLLFDDQFDGPRGARPELATAVVDEVSSVLTPTPTGHRPLSPVAASLADIWSREQLGMSDEWRQRAAANWRDYLASYVAEATNRHNSAPLSLTEYMSLRDITGVMPVLLDAMERLDHCELPAELHADQPLRHMRHLTVQVVDYIQDVLSLDKEEARGDPHNLVLVLEHERGCDRATAIGHVQRMVRARADEFLRREAELPDACDRFGLPVGQRADVYAFVAGMRHGMRGNYDWCASSTRYSARDIRPANQPGYLEDLTVPRPDPQTTRSG